MSNTKIDILFTLGDAEYSHAGDWPDYLQYGFDHDDVPALIKLVGDEALHSADGQGKEVWVPLHAWRTLGQLRSDAAVIPLINIFEVMTENNDDWALSELPKIMGMIGQPAIAPLATFMLDKDHTEFSRVMAGDGFCAVAKNNPALRDNVLKSYQEYLQQPDILMNSFNGLLVCFLLDLDAKELINEIRHLFTQQCVDLSCAGDIEDVEIVLGFRDKRETPKLTFEEMHGILPLKYPPAGRDNLIELLNYYFDHYGNDESILGVSELDGFFAALACIPNTIMPSVWMPALWGGEMLSPEWESENDFKEFSNAVLGIYNYVMTCMNDHEYQAMFLIREVEDKTYTNVDEWSNGFLRGIDLLGPIPAADAIVVEKALEPIRLFATERGFEQLAQLSEKEIENQQQAIEPAVHKLFDHFFSQRANLTASIVRAEPKVGRNAPCPCGSGKKYKKCCLH